MTIGTTTQAELIFCFVAGAAASEVKWAKACSVVGDTKRGAAGRLVLDDEHGRNSALPVGSLMTGCQFQSLRRRKIGNYR